MSKKVIIASFCLGAIFLSLVFAYEQDVKMEILQINSMFVGEKKLTRRYVTILKDTRFKIIAIDPRGYALIERVK